MLVLNQFLSLKQLQLLLIIRLLFLHLLNLQNIAISNENLVKFFFFQLRDSGVAELDVFNGLFVVLFVELVSLCYRIWSQFIYLSQIDF